MTLKQRIHHIMHGSHPEDRPSVFFVIFISTLILLNGVSVMLETMESLGHFYRHGFLLFEWISVGIFSIEYLARVWVADLTPTYQRSTLVKGVSTWLQVYIAMWRLDNHIEGSSNKLFCLCFLQGNANRQPERGVPFFLRDLGLIISLD